MLVPHRQRKAWPQGPHKAMRGNEESSHTPWWLATQKLPRESKRCGTQGSRSDVKQTASATFASGGVQHCGAEKGASQSSETGGGASSAGGAHRGPWSAALRMLMFRGCGHRSKYAAVPAGSKAEIMQANLAETVQASSASVAVHVSSPHPSKIPTQLLKAVDGPGHSTTTSSSNHTEKTLEEPTDKHTNAVPKGQEEAACTCSSACTGTKTASSMKEAKTVPRLSYRLLASMLPSSGHRDVTPEDISMHSDSTRLRGLGLQLDSCTPEHLLLGQFDVFGSPSRRTGGHAVIQFVRRRLDGREFAVKFFLDHGSFYTEAALYGTYFPSIHRVLQRPVAESAGHATALQRPPNMSTHSEIKSHRRHSTDAVPVSLKGAERIKDNVYIPPTGRASEEAGTGGAVKSSPRRISADRVAGGGAWFLPHVEGVCEGLEGELRDGGDDALPPCIVMEKGVSLQEWSARADCEKEHFTVISVIANIASRMRHMHAEGYAHRNLKPSNIILLPGETKWSVFDFGCAARIGHQAPLTFSMAYSPPEVVGAVETQQPHMMALGAVDVWALGVIAFELLTGKAVFDNSKDGILKVVAALRGDAQLPWEGSLTRELKRKLGPLRHVILPMLSRKPSLRPSMHVVHASIDLLDKESQFSELYNGLH